LVIERDQVKQKESSLRRKWQKKSGLKKV